LAASQGAAFFSKEERNMASNGLKVAVEVLDFEKIEALKKFRNRFMNDERIPLDVRQEMDGELRGVIRGDRNPMNLPEEIIQKPDGLDLKKFKDCFTPLRPFCDE
jgi:hypothetical protein